MPNSDGEQKWVQFRRDGWEWGRTVMGNRDEMNEDGAVLCMGLGDGSLPVANQVMGSSNREKKKNGLRSRLVE